MTEMSDRELAALQMIAEENYAHARDHENLRAQVTAILVAAAFVLVGLALDKGAIGVKLIFAAIFAILIGVLNIVLVFIHNNRFDMHVSVAENARKKIADLHAPREVKKKWSLYKAWLVVASLPILAGLGLLIIGCTSSHG